MIALLLFLQTTQPCQVPGLAALAQCGSLRVLENRERQDGKRITIRFALVPATSATARQAAQVPIVLLPGGPGGDIIRQAAAWTELLGSVRSSHPLLFVDPRGTGESDALHCELAAEPARVVTHVRDFLPIEQVRACRRELEKRADLTQYTTEAIAKDLDEVRAALGFERVILFGTSGGTRQALIYHKRHRRRVEALILSGMVPLEFRMPMHYAPDAQAAFDSLARSCATDQECARSFPDLRRDFESVLAALRREPKSVEVNLPSGVDTAIVTRGIFAERIRTLLYNSESAAQAPYVISRAARDDFAPFIQVMIPGLRPQRRPIVAMGHFLSVTCAEDVPRIAPDSAA
ncbi:MAG: alpha/beta hydrolase, partial [Gemmatimonadaceae bacterium]